MEEKIVYFEKPGISNTEVTLNLAKQRAVERKIEYIVLASTRGYTAKKALNTFKNTDIHLIAIPHQYGSIEGDLFSAAIKKDLEEAGHEVYISTHLFSTQRFWLSKNEISGTLINAFYRFCQGMKVCVEITLMTANAGKIPLNQDIIAIGGTDIGADTAIVIRPSTSLKFEDLQIKEIICKPIYSDLVSIEIIKERVKRMRARKM